MTNNDSEILARHEMLRRRDFEIGIQAQERADLYRQSNHLGSDLFKFPAAHKTTDFYGPFEYVLDPSELNLKSRNRWLPRKSNKGFGRVRALDVHDFVVFVPSHCVVTNKIQLIVDELHEADFVYGDSFHFAKDDESQFSYQLRPGWSPERLRGHCYVGDVVIASTKLVKRAGGRKMLCGLSEHDRALRLSENAEDPRHIDHLLYGSTFDNRMPQVDVEAVKEHCQRTRVKADVSLSSQGSAAKVIRSMTSASSVCLIIPTRGTYGEIEGMSVPLVVNALRTFFDTSNFIEVEVIVVADTATPQVVLDEINALGISNLTILEYKKPFNFAEKINVAALQTEAEFLLFVNDDTAIISPEIVSTMLSYFEDGGVGIVGPMLKYEDGTIQSAGHLLNPVPYDLYRGSAIDSVAGYGILNVAREVSSVIAAFSMTPRQLFVDAGGLCELFPSDYNDIDYAFKLSLLGYRTIVTPFAECFHFESKTRFPGEVPEFVARLGLRWQDQVENDPYGHRHLESYLPVWKANHGSPWCEVEAMGAGTVAL